MLLAACWCLAGVSGSGEVAVRPVPQVRLLSSAGVDVALFEPAADWRATVLVALGTGSRLSGLYGGRLADLAEEYGPEGIRFLALDPCPKDDAAAVAAFAADHGLDFPVLLDPFAAAAARLGLERATEVLVVDPDGRALYRGAVDDQHDAAGSRAYPGREPLVEVLEAVLAGEEVAVEPVPAPEELLDTDPRGTPRERVTFHRDVAPILRRHCVACHQAGRIGPMELVTFADVRGWAPMIAEVVEDGRMPPWHANPRYGTFENARALGDEERGVLLRWAATGAPEGEPADAPPPLPAPEDPEWTIGVPDLVVELPKSERIPAEGVVDYRYVVVDPELTEDCWVQAVEIQPTARSVTHHVLVLLIPPDRTADQVLGNDDFLLGAGHFAVYVPGAAPAIWPEGYAIEVQAGTQFLFQLHYTPDGTAAADRSRMAMRFAREAVVWPVRSKAVLNTGIRIPAGDAAVVQHAEHAFARPVEILALFPHLHARGTAFRFDLEDPEGARRTLLDVPAYDFNWQHTYVFREPVPVAANDRLILTGQWDNSAANPRNPDPERTVYWGDQTFEEMLVGYVTYVDDVD